MAIKPVNNLQIKRNKPTAILYLTILFITCKTCAMSISIPPVPPQADKNNETINNHRVKSYKNKLKITLKIVTKMLKELRISDDTPKTFPEQLANINPITENSLTGIEPKYSPDDNLPEILLKLPTDGSIQTEPAIVNDRKRKRDESDSWWPPEPRGEPQEKRAKIAY